MPLWLQEAGLARGEGSSIPTCFSQPRSWEAGKSRGLEGSQLPKTKNCLCHHDTKVNVLYHVSASENIHTSPTVRSHV